MFDFPPINSFRSFQEYFQLAYVILSFGLGMLIIIAYLSNFFKYNQRSSNSLFLALFVGFIHQGFASMTWLKSTYHIYGISDFVFDVYTFPVACFLFTFAVMCTKECSQEFRKITFAYVVYISTVLLLVFGIGVVRSSSHQYIHNNVTLNSSDKFFNDSDLESNCGIFDITSMFTISVLKCNSSFLYYIFEYFFIYAPITVILLWNIKESVLSDQQGRHHQLCITCDNTIRLQQYILMFMLFVIWIVRPISWIINFHYILLPQDIIPCMVLCMVYPFLLSYFVYNALYQEDFLDHRCRNKLYDFQEPEKQEKQPLV
ncbi:uncharacterized protein LOC127717984 [Mytilus californianus]|uniref:uncharacterized protein LOC127717984 n=1 Tax=Mytilus californianus TaxID=6549 RepID=UPI002247C599|nr:uncharacterized protein LOC127717984 [Mytilus californianus]